MFGFKPTKNGQIYGSPAWKMVKAVTKAIAMGLERDGKVSIQGFGTFYISKRKAYRSAVITNMGSKLEDREIYVGIMPASTRILFRPSASLRKFVNEGVKDDGTENTGNR